MYELVTLGDSLLVLSRRDLFPWQEKTQKRMASLVDRMRLGFVCITPSDNPVSSPLSVKSSELQTIKTELTQIKSNIDALLGRLEQIAEEQKANPGQLLRR